MEKQQPSTKRTLIDKANRSVVIITSVATFVVIFSVVASKALISQATYQNRVISAEKKSLSQIQQDLAATGSLQASFNAFTGTSNNIIGGLSKGTGSQDGNNAEIILDALPSSYDFPALTNSLEALLNNAGVQINSISGTDDEIAQGTNVSSVSPQPVAMPFQISVTGDYDSIQKLVDAFGHSIRPFQIQTMQISGDQKQLTLNLSAQTFYQPAKSLNVQSETVK
jgi:hypothetical protein